MLIGHYAPAFILQRARPSVKLWHLFLATQFVDILWGLCILGGIEHLRVVPGFTQSNDLDLWDMPYTHSLVATGVWSLLAFVVWRALNRKPTRTGDALVIAIAVASHFAGDYIVHAGDLPIFAAQGPKLGLGLWRYRSIALAVETGLFAASSLWWWFPLRKRTGSGAVAGWLVGMTAVAAASFFIPTPPSAPAMALTGLATYAICTALAAWADRRLDTLQA